MTTTMSRLPPRWRKWAWVTTAAIALAAVFVAYQSPHLVVDLASRVWACF